MAQDDLFLILATVSVVVAFGILSAFVLWSRAMQRRSARQAGTDGSVLNNWTGATRNQHKVLWYSVATMSIITVCVGSIPTYLLYSASFEGQRQRLVEMATGQARLIEAVARFDRLHSETSIPGGATAATVSQIVDAHQKQSGIGRTGEVTLARLDGDNMIFLLEPRHATSNQSSRIPYRGSKLAEPMRRALSGQSGTIIATDYRGELVLAAYEPVGELQLGIVAKIDLSEIRRPFFLSAIVGLGVATLLIITGGLVLVRVNAPLIKQLQKLSSAVEQSPSSVVITDVEGHIEYVNPKFTQVTGYAPEEVRGKNSRMLKSGEQPREFYEDLWKTILAGREWRGEFHNLRKNGELYWEQASISPINRDDGKITHFVAVKEDITARKAAEERFRVLFEQSSDAHLIFDEQGIIDCNNAAVDVLRCKDKGELLLKHPAEFSPEVQPDGERSMDKAPLMIEIATREGYHRFEWMHVRMDGEEFLVEVTLTPVTLESRPAILVVWHDLTKRKKMEEELRRANFLSDIALDLTGCAYWHVDYSDPDYYYKSERAAKVLGEPSKPDGRYHVQDEWFARMVEANPQTAEETAERYQGAIEGRYENYESTYAYKRLDGEIIWLHAVGKVDRDEDGKARHMYGAYQDITERKRAEDTVLEARYVAEQAKIAAEAANRAKSDFLSHMSHELRTPLNGILGYAQILQRDEGFTNRQQGNLESIVNCGDHLLALINDVLDLSKIEAGRLEVDMAPFDLHGLIKGVADIVRERATRKGITFVQDVSAEMPRGIVSDAAKLRQILVNLLGNAVKFTAAGQVTLQAREDPHGFIEFIVGDTGVGMTTEEIVDIFDPFKQVEAGKAAGGTGLGLAITKRLAEALGATVDVVSEKGTGSKFTVVIPLLEAESEAWPETLDEDSREVERFLLAEGQQWTILIADDRDTNRDVLQGMLEPAGFRTRLAKDGDEALEVLRAHDDVDLVLMDIRMPRVNGIEALQSIRADGQLRDMKVIAVTASVFPEFRQKAIAAGFNDFLAKPFRTEELMTKLEKLLGAEFDTESQELAAANIDAHCDDEEEEVVPEEQIERLRDALKVKNITAICDLAAVLSADPATSKTGHRLTSLMDAFDFAGLDDLASDLEKQHE